MRTNSGGERREAKLSAASEDVAQHARAFDPARTGILRGVQVLDLSRLLAGNMLSLQLGDFGAEVTKVEPLVGDPLRDWRNDGKSLHWKVYGRNKRSLALNVREVAAKEVLLRLVEQSDVFIENFRPGTLEAMGLGPSVLHEHNPRLIIVRISGFGQTGPYAALPGFGTLVEAMSGFADQNGFPDREPVLPPLGFADKIAGLYGAMSVAMALLARDRGLCKGQVIDLSLLEPTVSVLSHEAAIYRETGKCSERCGSASNTSSPRNVYRCGDGRFVALSGSMQAMARRVFEVIGRPELIHDPRFSTNSARVRHRALVDKTLGEWFATKTRDEALQFMRRAGVTVGPVNSIADIVEDVHFRGRNVLLEVPDAELGSVLTHNIVPRLSVTPGVWRRPAPALGEHTEAVLAEIGYDDAAIARLRAGGAIL